MPEPLVSVDNLSKVYEPTPGWMRVLVRSPTRQPVVALDGVTFDVEPGQICAIIGPNGAGKSTLFRVLTGLTTPTGGSCQVLGMNPVSDAHRIRRNVGFMPSEDRTLFLRHTCRENLRFHGRLQGLEEPKLRRQIDDVLDVVGLSEARDRTGFALSSGMRARLMLARAILHEPKVLILDEPTGTIDPLAAHDFLEVITQVTGEKGMATLVSSHRLEEIDALRDNVMLLDQGRVIFWGNLDHVREVAGQKAYEAVCTNPDSAGRVARLLQSRLGPAALIETKGPLVIFQVMAGNDGDLSWVADLGHEVESVAVRRLSLRETISVLLTEGTEA